jgi:hypothetical protein
LVCKTNDIFFSFFWMKSNDILSSLSPPHYLEKNASTVLLYLHHHRPIVHISLILTVYPDPDFYINLITPINFSSFITRRVPSFSRSLVSSVLLSSWWFDLSILKFCACSLSPLLNAICYVVFDFRFCCFWFLWSIAIKGRLVIDSSDCRYQEFRNYLDLLSWLFTLRNLDVRDRCSYFLWSAAMNMVFSDCRYQEFHTIKHFLTLLLRIIGYQSLFI